MEFPGQGADLFWDEAKVLSREQSQHAHSSCTPHPSVLNSHLDLCSPAQRGLVSIVFTNMIPPTLLSLFTLAVVPLVTSIPASGGVPAHFPISRRSNKARGPADLAKAADHLRSKYNFKPLGTKQKRAGNTAAVPITNQVRYILPRISCISNSSIIMKY
jgi:hypothetical protein